ncbi:hypothetical protein OGATHE_001619 [Ogataea polymorpha]|uniref:Uncharacterized protein n=1 Tax=Ogataea polymorpha TaxID=460523 RepID=A0A9P8PPQ7_9ASCO|nr:hypothetical protein OGATHE_001619 [Ogataea polymorpha]
MGARAFAPRARPLDTKSSKTSLETCKKKLVHSGIRVFWWLFVLEPAEDVVIGSTRNCLEDYLNGGGNQSKSVGLGLREIWDSGPERRKQSHSKIRADQLGASAATM